MTATLAPAKKRTNKRPVPSPTFASSENPHYVDPDTQSLTRKPQSEIPWQDRLIPLDTLTISPMNRRHLTKVDKAKIDSLAESIRSVGVIEPILVREAPTAGYELLAGRRRYEAAKLAGLTVIPGRYAALDDKRASEIITIENLQREGLTPIEEGEQVQTLLDTGHSFAAAAIVLGKSENWVATRAKLSNLSPRWIAALADPEHEVHHWTVAHYVVVAKLKHANQDDVLESFDGYMFDTPTQIDKQFQSMFLLKLSAAPWDLEAPMLYPEAGTCTACPKRTAAEPMLWPDLVAAKDDCCLDSACYQIKKDSFVRGTALKIREKTGIEPIKIVQRTDLVCDPKTAKLPAGMIPSYHAQPVKQNTPNAVPAIHFDGHRAGEVVYIQNPNTPVSAGSKNRASSSADGEPAQKSMTVKRKELDRKRMAKAVELVREALDTEDFESTKMSHIDLVKLAAVFGTDAKKPYINEYGNGKGAAWEVFAAIKTEAKAHQLLWEEIRGVFHDRLKLNGPVTTSEVAETAWTEAAKLCGLINLKAQHYLDTATNEIKEPKSWKTAFGAGHGPKKANKLKQRG